MDSITPKENCSNIIYRVAIDPSVITGKTFGEYYVPVNDPQDVIPDLELIKAIFQATRFNYRLVTAADGQYGVCNTSCTGMVGMLVEKRASLAVNLAATPMRGKFVTFSPTYDFQDLTFVTKSAEFMQNGSTFFFLKPFPLTVWIAIGIFAVMYAIGVITIYFKPKCVSKIRISNFELFPTCTPYATRITNYHLIALSIAFISSGFLGKFYGGYMTSSASWKPKSIVINTVEDIANAVKNRGYSIDFITGSSSQEVMMKSTTPDITILVNHMRKNGFRGVDSYRTGLLRVLREDFALVAGRPYIRLNIRKEQLNLHDFHLANEGIYPDNSVVAYTTNLPCRKKFDLAILKILASGLFEKWKITQEQNANKGVPETTLSNDNSFIVYEDIRILFIAVVVLYFVYVGVCLMEIYLHPKVEKRRFTTSVTSSSNDSSQKKIFKIPGQNFIDASKKIILEIKSKSTSKRTNSIENKNTTVTGLGGTTLNREY